MESNYIHRLVELLGSHYIVMTYAWGCHWNVTGNGFKAAHDFLKELYEAEQDRIDSTAERIRALGSTCPATMLQMEQATLIDSALSSSEFTMTSVWLGLSELWKELISIACSVHAVIPDSDIATKSFLENMVESMQKELWMIDANIAK